MQLELNKIIGLDGRLTFDEVGLFQEIGFDTKFTTTLYSGEDILFSFIQIPIVKHGNLTCPPPKKN